MNPGTILGVMESAITHIGEVVVLPLADIRPSPRNPRQRLDDVEDLAESIREYGLLQPVVVRQMEDGYEIVAGHRRAAAVKLLGWQDIPVMIRAADESEAYLLTLIENLQREDLTSREESRALEVLVRERGWSTRQVAQAVKRSQAYVSKRLRVFEDHVLAPLVLSNQLPVSVAEELLPAPPQKRKHLAQRAITEQLEGSTVRKLVRDESAGRRERRSARRNQSLLQQLRSLRSTLNNTLPQDLQETHRREMRLLFLHLAMLAKSPQEKHSPPVIPALPKLRERAG